MYSCGQDMIIFKYKKTSFFLNVVHFADFVFNLFPYFHYIFPWEGCECLCAGRMFERIHYPTRRVFTPEYDLFVGN